MQKKNIDINSYKTKKIIHTFQTMYKKLNIKEAKFLLKKLANQINFCIKEKKNYLNTIKKKEKINKKEIILEKKIENIIKWNAIIIVLKAAKNNPEIGGHIGTYASSSTLYEVGFNHFWKASGENQGDLIYIQGHNSPGIYSRSFMEGRLKKKHIINFRKETNKNGLPAYPNPRFKKYWEFPTISMGLGPIQAVHKARFIHYLLNRNIINKKNSERKVWCMCGDGEMEEPESTSAITLAGREKLNNLIFVINCNLQGLDGPIRGNGKIICELENIFCAAKWEVIKVIWNKKWDILLKKDNEDFLKKRMYETLDGDYQAYKGLNANYMKHHFFNTKKLKNLIKNYTKKKINELHYGGHDYENILSAYKRAIDIKNKPVVILVKTTKGFNLGPPLEASNSVHSNKYFSDKNLINLKKKLKIPISNTDAIKLKLYKPKKQSEELMHLIKKRKNLGGFIPNRKEKSDKYILIPNINIFNNILKKEKQKSSTMMTVIKIIFTLYKENTLSKIIIPIIPDVGRTFGMESLFKELKIYSKFGQKYNPIDLNQLIFYNESTSGQILQEGVNEAGAFSTWIAAATTYSTINKITIPFYIFYSIFGFQRIGDLAWAAANAKTRGFLIGGIAGKTSLPGEGLQHCDGNSQILSSLIPNCISYDPAYNFELVIIIHHGLKEMFQKQKNVFYYITTYNEVHKQNIIKINNTLKKNIIKGIYLLKRYNKSAKIELLGSGNILLEIIKAANILKNKFNILSNIWSVTSYTELARNARKITRFNKTNDNKKNIKKPFITKCFDKIKNPILAISDYAKLYTEQLREFLPNKFMTLGTDGFGVSDSRENLKHHFEIDKFYIVYTVLFMITENKFFYNKNFKKIKNKYKIEYKG